MAEAALDMGDEEEGRVEGDLQISTLGSEVIWIFIQLLELWISAVTCIRHVLYPVPQICRRVVLKLECALESFGALVEHSLLSPPPEYLAW